jgi:hypothetical protein
MKTFNRMTLSTTEIMTVFLILNLGTIFVLQILLFAEHQH